MQKKASNLTWEQAVTKICSIGASSKSNMYNLNGVKALYKYVGDPLEKYRVIHTAGTNGKGSVSAMLSACFIADNQKVGLCLN